MEGLKQNDKSSPKADRSMTKRSWRMGLSSGISVVIALAVVLFVGGLAARHHYRADFTEDAIHTLAPQTKKVLKNLKSPVKSLAFYGKSQPDKPFAQTLLDRYSFDSKDFSFKFVDPVQQPSLAKRYEISRAGTVVLLAGKKQERVEQLNEQSLTNALIRLQRNDKKTIYFLTGNGERSLEDKGKTGYSQLKKSLEQQNFEVKSLIFSLAKEVPQNASAVIAAAPRKAYTDKEIKRLSDYLERGGSLLVMIDPEAKSGLSGWLKKHGVILGNDLVIDEASVLFGASPAWPVGAIYGKHPITDPMKGLFAYFPVCRSVRPAAKLPAGAKAVSLIKGTKKSWAETDLEALKKEDAQVEFNKDKDRAGPISLATAVSLPAPNGPKTAPAPAMAQLVVFGDSDFADNTHFGQAGNRDLVLNTIGFLVKEDDLVSIRPKQTGPQLLLLKPLQAKLLFWVPVVLLPGIFVILGVVVVWRRKRKA